MASTPLAQSVFLHLVEQGLVTDLKSLGRFLAIPTCLGQHAFDDLLLSDMRRPLRDRLQVEILSIREVRAQGCKIELIVIRLGCGRCLSLGRRSVERVVV